MGNQMLKFVVNTRGRLAKLVSEQCELPYSAVRKLLRDKDIKVNGKRVKDDLICEIGDFIEVYAPNFAQLESTLSPLYCDDYIAVFNKPAGITSESFLLKVQGVCPNAIAVHRLDRNTRGIIIYALCSTAEAELLSGFKKRSFKKLYVTEVLGIPRLNSATLTAYLNKDCATGTVYVHSERRPGDVEIKTAYRVIGRGDGVSAMEVELLTGKTHQIRAHLAHIGHPIIGDDKYGDAQLNKRFGARYQRLQAFSLTLYFDDASPLAYLNGREFAVPKEFGNL